MQHELEAVSGRAAAIVKGLIATKRAVGVISIDQHTLRIACCSGGHYWIPRDGRQVLRGKTYDEAEELQPSFGEAMEKAGRRMSFRSLGPRPMGSVWPTG